MVDPAGACYGYSGVATGAKEQTAMSALEKIYSDIKKEIDESKEDRIPLFGKNEKETVEYAIEALQKVLGIDFKSNQVEVAVVTKNKRKFKLLSQKEIDQYLTDISEKDG